MDADVEIRTARLRLLSWRESHRDAFAAMHANPEVMADLGGPIDRTSSDAKLDRYIDTYQRYRTSRWAVESRDGRFLGYAGVMARPATTHPLGFHYEIGWRFNRTAWGHGYATESASAAIEHAVRVTKLDAIVAYALPDNLRSLKVMERLGLLRRADLDFSEPTEDGGIFEALVWKVEIGRYR